MFYFICFLSTKLVHLHPLSCFPISFNYLHRLATYVLGCKKLYCQTDLVHVLSHQLMCCVVCYENKQLRSDNGIRPQRLDFIRSLQIYSNTLQSYKASKRMFGTRRTAALNNGYVGFFSMFSRGMRPKPTVIVKFLHPHHLLVRNSPVPYVNPSTLV